MAFLCILQELGYHHRVFLRHGYRHPEVFLQLVLVVADVHGGAGQHVAGAHQDGIAHLGDEAFHVVQAGEFLPGGLVDAKKVEHVAELVAVLGPVDAHGRGSQDGHCLAVELHGEVVRYLSAHGDDDAARLLQVDDVEHTLKGQFVEVEAVAHVVVGGHGLRVVVYHDGLIAQLARRLDGVHRAPVELHAGADAVGARAEDNHGLLVLVIVHVVAFGAVRHVQVVGQFGMLARHGVDALHGGHDAQLLAAGAHQQVLFLHRSFGMEHEAGNLEVGEAHTSAGMSSTLLYWESTAL